MSNKSEYWEKFPDGSPQRWQVEKRDKHWNIAMPNGAVIDVDIDAPKLHYDADFPQDRESSRLWANSLRYIVPMLGEGDYETAWTLLSQLSDILAQDLKDEHGRFSGSLDHQFALQLRTLCELRAWLLKRPQSGDTVAMDSVLTETVASIYRHVQSIGLLRPNNHGIMLGISLLHSFYMFEDVPWKPSGQSSESGRDEVEQFLLESLFSVLGTDGVANENTPIYQGFYLKLLSGITDFQTWAYGTAHADFAAMNSKATTAYRHMLLPNGAVPPLGDASVSMQRQLKALPGLWTTVENGLLVRSNSDSFFSFVCGYRGVFHKQLDDSSIFLWHKGDALIQDAGLKSYDGNDPVAVGIRGQLGHSGLFFPSFDSLRAEKVVAYGSGTRLISASMEVRNDDSADSFQAVGRYTFRDVAVERCVTWTGERSFMLRDLVRADSASGRAVSRFLLDPQAEVRFMDSGVVAVRTDRAWMTIAGNDGRVNVNLTKGVSGGEGASRGFLAPKNYSSEPTYMLEFEVPLSAETDSDKLVGKHLLRIVYGGVDEPLTVHQ
ncbi:hypothetical protein D8M31_00150 [Corynebacterium genitalium]|nr:hypothetical protein D8M31_00150 [Corynebacterium genitalium]